MATLFEQWGCTDDLNISAIEQEYRDKEARIVHTRIGIRYDDKDAAEYRGYLGL